MNARPLRLWPGAAALGLQALALLLSVTPAIDAFTRFFFMAGGPGVSLLLFLVWLLFFSRLPRLESLQLLGLALVLALAAAVGVDASVRGGLWFYGVPVSMLVLFLAVALGAERPAGWRRLVLASGFGGFLLLLALVRIEGYTGAYLPELAWRWAETHEESLEGRVATGSEIPATGEAAAESIAEGAWASYRGPERNGRVSGFSRTLDWASAPPQEVWRVEMGPAWSSFVASGGRLFTQEQRGDREVVACYRSGDGALLWEHGVEARFSEVISGAGPRATPTLAGGRLFTLGATGILLALDAAGGDLLWRHDLMEETGAPLPQWGFSSSPLVADGRVIVYAGGEGEQGLLAYEAETGALAWQLESRGMNFSSAQPARLDGVDLVLFADTSGVMAVEPESGSVLWRFRPEDWQTAPMVQIQQIGPVDLVVPLGDGVGLARLEGTRTAGEWQVREVWSSRALKPSFNDFVFHEGNLYGFDQNIFVAADAASGERLWKRGRYGFGQVLLLPAAGQLIVISEKGELILLAADPTEHRELGRFQALDGKTWNHPIVAGERLIVRNGTEAAAYRL